MNILLHSHLRLPKKTAKNPNINYTKQGYFSPCLDFIPPPGEGHHSVKALLIMAIGTSCLFICPLFPFHSLQGLVAFGKVGSQRLPVIPGQQKSQADHLAPVKLLLQTGRDFSNSAYSQRLQEKKSIFVEVKRLELVEPVLNSHSEGASSLPPAAQQEAVCLKDPESSSGHIWQRSSRNHSLVLMYVSKTWEAIFICGNVTRLSTYKKMFCKNKLSLLIFRYNSDALQVSRRLHWPHK